VSDYVPPFEYQYDSCDYLQVGHLCNHMAGYGWEPISMADGHHDGAMTYETVSDEGSPLRNAVKLMVVLFRRPSNWGEEKS